MSDPIDPTKTPGPEAAPDESPAEQRRKTFARRALIQAGWALPAVAIFALPKDLGAASAHQDGALGPHADAPAAPHTDIPGIHSDTPIGHFDAGHVDGGAPHFDFGPGHQDAQPGHTDTVHDDGGGPVHGDMIGP